MKETTIYMLSGGGQKARECAELGLKIEIERCSSDLPARTGLAGQAFRDFLSMEEKKN